MNRRNFYIHVLDHFVSYPGVERNVQYGVYTYCSRDGVLPSMLTGSSMFSWRRHVERLLNDEAYAGIPGSVKPYELKDVQIQPVSEIAEGYAADRAGYVMALGTGKGKTLAAVAGLSQTDAKKVLVLSPLSNIGGWSDHIRDFSDRSIEWVVTNPERLWNLLHIPDKDVDLHLMDETERDRLLAASGVPVMDFDAVVVDESHALAFASTLRSSMWRRIMRWGEKVAMPYSVHLSATPWSNPLETTSVSHIIAEGLGVGLANEWVLENDYGEWLRDNARMRLNLDSDNRWSWEANFHDIAILNRLLYSDGRGVSDANNGSDDMHQERTLLPVFFTDEEKVEAEMYWDDFRKARSMSDRAYLAAQGPFAKMIRIAQQLSLIKARHVAEVAVDLYGQGYQVIVPAWFSETVIEIATAAARLLKERHGDDLWVTTLTGRDSRLQREERRRAFQSGKAVIVVTSITESINLHAGEPGGGLNGEDATTTPRITVFSDVLRGGKKAYQAEGRGQRNGQKADAVYTYAKDTSEVEFLIKTFTALVNTRSLTVGDARLLHSDWDVASFETLTNKLREEWELFNG